MTTSPPEPDTTVVLTVTRPNKGALRWIQAFRADDELGEMPLVVMYTERAIPLAGILATLAPEVELVPLLEDTTEDRVETARAYASVFRRLATPYFALTNAPRRLGSAIEKLRTQLANGRQRLEDLGLSTDRPLLVYTRQTKSTPVRSYIWDMLSDDSTPDETLRDYLGYLALMTGALHLEGVDPLPAEGRIEVFARASIGRFNSSSPPPWRYRIVIRDRHRPVLTEARAEVSQRVSNKGIRRWENLRATLSLSDVPDGNHLIMLGLDTEQEALRVLRPLAPRSGALACARTFLLRGSSPADRVRYLIHTIRTAPQTWITVQHGTGKRARRTWYRALVRKDLRTVLRDRSVGRRMRLARLIRLVTAPLMKRREIWLIGERVDTAQDNGYHLFRYLRTAHPDREVYYVLDKSSPHFERVRDLGNVVQHSSWRHQFLMMHASVLANAYSVKHMVPRNWTPTGYTRHLAWRVGAVRVYLKHGVNVSANSVKRGTGGYDLYLSVNPKESAALRESSGYERQIVETGMPRYDALEPGPTTRTVLFMPTWRRYLVPKLFSGMDESLVPFHGSTYETFLRSFLASPRLHEILERYDYRLQFLPHYNLREELSSLPLTSPRTVLADTDHTPFQDLIRGCDAFITDHSSVHFDVAYLGTPIIYTHFDKQEYAEGHASVSWFEHVRDGFGPVVYTLDETLDALEELLARDCAPDPYYIARVDAAFTYRDHDNCNRVTEVVRELLQESAVNP